MEDADANVPSHELGGNELEWAFSAQSNDGAIVGSCIDMVNMRFAALAAMGISAFVGITTAACGGASSPDVIAPPVDGGGGGDAASSGDAGDGATSSATYTLDDVCDRTAPVICDLRKACCTASAEGYDEAGCLSHARAECAQDVAAARAGAETFHPERINACEAKLKEILGVSCSLTYDLIQKYFHDIATCNTFEGSLPTGATCDRASECQPPASQDQLSGCDDTTKKCQITTVVAENGACSLASGTNILCDDGLYCDVDFSGDAGGAGTCRKKTALGSACDKNKLVSLECGLSNYCDIATSQCTPGKKANAACTSDLECASVKCGRAGDASTGTGTCTAPADITKPEECKGP